MPCTAAVTKPTASTGSSANQASRKSRKSSTPITANISAVSTTASRSSVSDETTVQTGSPATYNSAPSSRSKRRQQREHRAHRLAHRLALDRLQLDDDAGRAAVRREHGAVEEALLARGREQRRPIARERQLPVRALGERARLERTHDDRRVQRAPGAPHVRARASSAACRRPRKSSAHGSAIASQRGVSRQPKTTSRCTPLSNSSRNDASRSTSGRARPEVGGVADLARQPRRGGDQQRRRRSRQSRPSCGDAARSRR